MNENKMAIAIPAEVLTDLITKLNAIHLAIAPYIVPLTVEERKTMLKMNDKTEAFVRKVGDYTVHNPEFVPSYMNADDFKMNFDNVFGIDPVLSLVSQLFNNLSDTAMTNGSGALGNALIYYNNVKQADKLGVTNARAIYQDLQQRFPGRPKKETIKKSEQAA
jgi:hypothetical protein